MLNKIIKILLIFTIIVIILFSFLFFYLKDDFEFGNVSDQVIILDSMKVNNKEYKLILTISGFQDKVFFLDLYNKNHIENSLYGEIIYYGPENKPLLQYPEKIEIVNEKIMIKYSKDIKNYKQINEIPIIWK